MGQTLYLECASGISGDMTVAALLDLGASEEKLRRALASLPVSGYEVRISRVKKAALDCCDFDVVLDAEHENHDHDMEYLFGHEHGHGEGAHDHGHEHADEVHHHHHEHRGLADIQAIIDAGDLTPGAKQLAQRIFQIIGEAESKAHGVPIDQVHFHEVGAVDSIVDIVAAAVCLDDLGITECLIPQIGEGEGTVRSAHGILPIPVPAVVNIAAAHGLVLSRNGMRGEFVTPTGAAIAAAICTGTRPPMRMRILRTGLGAGKRAYERPSILRAMLIEDASQSAPASASSSAMPDVSVPAPVNLHDTAVPTSADGTPALIWKLETEMDDCTGEQLAFALEALLEAGALEAHYIPVFMKKNRPGYQIQVLCRENQIAQMEAILFTHTTTIGIRRAAMQRTPLDRTFAQVATAYGDIQVKTVALPDGTKRSYPEYASVVEACKRTGAAYQQVYQAAFNAGSE